MVCKLKGSKGIRDRVPFDKEDHRQTERKKPEPVPGKFPPCRVIRAHNGWLYSPAIVGAIGKVVTEKCVEILAEIVLRVVFVITS